MRRLFLLLSSYALYMIWKPAFALVLLGVSLITYWGGQVLCVDKNSNVEGNKRKHLVWLFTLLGLLPLLFFKYYNFLNDSISAGLASVGLQFSLPGLNWAVPVGISFFTFQAVGYMLDVYHGRNKAEKNLLDYMLFVSFFPQVASGPISKSNELLPQIKSLPSFDYSKAINGLKLIIWGLFLKMVLADRLGLYVDVICGNYTHYSGLICCLSALFYSFQIYGDFAGYSLMAIGIAQLLGITLPENFRRPYFSTSISDFWRRWHISLSRWLKDYIYIPLGGSRCSKAKNYWNIIVTFFVSGIWHGANWTFIVWGLIHGGIQVLEKSTGYNKNAGMSFVVRVARICLTFVLVTVAWIFFRMPSINDSFLFIGQMFSFDGMGLPDNGFANIAIIAVSFVLLIVKDVSDEIGGGMFTKMPSWCSWTFHILLIAFIIACGVMDSGQFIYTSF